MRLIRTVIFALICLSAAVSNVSADGGLESPFNFGAGARDLALGGAALANGDAVTAPFWNASRLATAEHLSLGAFHSRMYDSDVAYQYFGLIYPTLDFGSFGLGVFRLGIDGIEKRDAGNLYLYDFDDNRLGLFLAYGRSLSGYDAGLTLTLESHSVDTYSATSSPGLNLSVGRIFEPALPNVSRISLALVGRNLIAPSVQLVSSDVSYPRAADFSVTTAILPSRNWNQTLLLSVSVTDIEDVDPMLAAGLEYNVQDMLYVRGGVRNNKMSFGAGLSYSLLTFDYALVDRDLGSLHMFSITTAFGSSVTERRFQRAREREDQFNHLMDQRIMQQNQEMVTELVTEGERLLSDDDFAPASELFDRALFLARGTGGDTVEIASLSATAHARQDQFERETNHTKQIDSARVNFSSGQYLAARYFARQAQSIDPESPEALFLIGRIDSAIEQAESRDQMIHQQLHLVDSLINYGQTEKALSVARSLTEYAPDNTEVKLTVRKATFEHLRTSATRAYERSDNQSALSDLDSALVLFPGHQWCLDLRNRIVMERARIASTAAPKAPTKAAPVSEKIRKEIDREYRAGQEFFARGELQSAVDRWEKVSALAPDYMSVRQYLVKAYKFIGVDLYGQDQLNEAIAIWKKAADLEPTNTEIAGYIERAQNEIRNLRELSYDN